jgi:hypothetical protein
MNFTHFENSEKFTIGLGACQILAYADDVDIIGRMQKAMKEAFTNLEKAAKKIHLQINQGKIKIYIPVTKKICADGPKIGSYKFETIYSFTYLGSEVNYKTVSVDIQKHVISKQMFSWAKKTSKVALDLKENQNIDV